MKFKSILFSLCISTIPLSYATDIEEQDYSQPAPFDPAKSVTIEKITAYQLALIRNQEALEKMQLQKSPLDYLSRDSKRRFINSLKFGKNGLSSFYYSDLETELTPTQIYNILSLFGAQHLTYLMQDARVESSLDATLLLNGPDHQDDHKEYECEKPATCMMSTGRICTSNC